MIFLPNGKDWILAWWGATILGAIFVPINTSYKGEMLRHNCMDAQTRYIITTPD
jgi:crotonobetaine/carnitine-CoA ligase